MDQSEAYAFLFTDVVFSNFVIIPRLDLALPVMKALGFYSNHSILLYSLLGSVVAVIFNYLFGIILYNLYRFSTDQEIKTKYVKFSDVFKKYGGFFLLLTFVPNVGKFLPLMAGFTRYGIVRTIIYSTISKVLYYGWFIYY